MTCPRESGAATGRIASIGGGKSGVVRARRGGDAAQHPAFHHDGIGVGTGIGISGGVGAVIVDQNLNLSFGIASRT